MASSQHVESMIVFLYCVAIDVRNMDIIVEIVPKHLFLDFVPVAMKLGPVHSQMTQKMYVVVTVSERTN